AELSSRDVVFFKPLGDTDDGLRGFELEDADGYVLFFGGPIHGASRWRRQQLRKDIVDVLNAVVEVLDDDVNVIDNVVNVIGGVVNVIDDGMKLIDDVVNVIDGVVNVIDRVANVNDGYLERHEWVANVID